jgi:hypothetical protein
MRRLIIRPGAIGDFVVSIPAMECLRTAYLEVWAASQNLPLARFAAHTRSIVATGLDLLGVTDPDPRLIEELRGFDSIVSWYGANRPDFRQLVRTLELPFEFLNALPSPDGEMHAADFFLKQARTLVNCQSDGIPRIPCTGKRSSFAVIHPFASSPRKCWPLERFRQLARRLEERLTVQWCAGPEETLSGAVRFDDLYELAVWLSTARLYIGNDSGIAHVAAAAGTPTIVLFGPTNPAHWAPRGREVRIVAQERMDLIRVEDVENAACLLLART